MESEEENIEITPEGSLAKAAQFPSEIERICAVGLSYDRFFHRFMEPNISVILTSIAENWECYCHWISRGADGSEKVDINFLKERIRNMTVPVADCSKQYYNSHNKIEMKLHDFLDSWNCTDKHVEISSLYLKDWHLRELQADYSFYETPIFFASDWLNEYLIDRKIDDYMFVYMGPKGTWTSFHADVFSSYSWSVNILGVKKWLLLPPGEENKLRDSLGNLPFEISEELLDGKEVSYHTVFQTAGEAIYVPSGWYHQVRNEEDTISVNHNWFNGCNIAAVWSNLNCAYEQVIREIEDCRDMPDFDEHCQLMLKASHGMNFEGFLDILTHVGDKRVNAYANNVKLLHFEKYSLGRNHIRFDLEAIRDVLILMTKDRILLEKLHLLDRAVNCIQMIDNLFI